MTDDAYGLASIYNQKFELEFQIQLGGKLYPEYPVKSINECFSILKQTLNLPDHHQHSIGIEFKDYVDYKFVFAMDFQKVPEASWTGVNSKAGQILIVKVNALDKTVDGIDGVVNKIGSTMYITLVSENILEIRDTGCAVYD